MGTRILAVAALLMCLMPWTSANDASSSSSSSRDDSAGAKSSADKSEPELKQTRSARSEYGYGGGYGGGCSSCPYQAPCDSGKDILLYFSAGTLLGLLFSMMQTNMMTMAPAAAMMMPPGAGMMMPPGAGMMMPPPAPAPMMRRHEASKEDKKMDDDEGTTQGRTMPSADSFMALIANDVAPLAADLISVYAKSQERPQCARRLLCDLIQSVHGEGADGQNDDVDRSLKTRLTSLSSEVLSWLLLKDVEPELGGILDQLLDRPDVQDPLPAGEDGGHGRRRSAVDCASLPASKVDCDFQPKMSFAGHGWPPRHSARSPRSTQVPRYND